MKSSLKHPLPSLPGSLGTNRILQATDNWKTTLPHSPPFLLLTTQVPIIEMLLRRLCAAYRDVSNNRWPKIYLVIAHPAKYFQMIFVYVIFCVNIFIKWDWQKMWIDIIKNWQKCIIYILKSYKDWRLKKETKAYQRFLIEKVRFFFHSFTCIFSDYMAHDITKEFWKISDFENMTAGFLKRCQNLLRYFTPETMHFQAWKKWF